MHKRLSKLKIMNFRPFVILAIFMILATFCAVIISHSARLVLFVIFISSFGVALVLAGVMKKKWLLMISAVLLSVSMAFGHIYAKSKTLDNYQKYAGEDVSIYAKIAENYNFTASGNLSLTLADVYIETSAGYEKISGKITLYTNPNNLDLTKFSVGRYLSIKTNLTVFDLNGDFADNKRAISFLSNGVVGYAYSSFYNIKVTDTQKVSVRDYVCNDIRNDLLSVDLKYADLGFVMLFGESSYLDDSIQEEFRLTGIAHLLAVSGLHFSIIFMIINFIAKVAKANKKSNFLVTTIIIILYCYLCKFSVSVIRAGVMAFIASYAKIRHKPYDRLSALALVLFAILCVNPLKLFNISLVLSFIAVFSIIMLVPIFSNFFSKFFKEKMVSAISVNLAVQIGMFAVNLYYFGRYAIFSGIINLLLIPISNVAFGFLFVGVLLSNVFPLAIYLSKVFDFLIDIIVKMNGYFMGNGIYLSVGNLSFLPVVLMIAIMVIISEYIFLKKRNKLIGVSLMAILSGLVFLL